MFKNGQKSAVSFLTAIRIGIRNTRMITNGAQKKVIGDDTLPQK